MEALWGIIELPDLSQVSLGPSHFHYPSWGLAVDQIPISSVSFSPFSRQGKQFAQSHTGGDSSGVPDRVPISYLKVGAVDHTISVGLVKA